VVSRWIFFGWFLGMVVAVGLSVSITRLLNPTWLWEALISSVLTLVCVFSGVAFGGACALRKDTRGKK
jgi:TctA family transporter